MAKHSSKSPSLTRKKAGAILGASVATLLAALVFGPANDALATTYTWNVPGGGSWETPSNWTPNTGFPGSGDTADIAGVGGMITLGSAQPVENINFQGAGLFIVGAVGGNSLQLTSGGTIATQTSPNSDTVNAPVVIEGTNGTYTFSSGNTITSSVLDFGGGITGGAAGATVLTLSGLNTGANTISGIIANGSATTLGITVAASGGPAVNWILSGMNTYTGPTQIGAGATLQAGSTQAFGVGSAVSLTASVATLDLAGYSNTIGSLTGVAGSFVNNSSSTAATLTVGDSTPSTTFAGVIENTGGGALSLVKQGSGTLILSGANTYTGGTTINAGTLQVSSDGNLGSTSGGVTINGGTLLINGGTTPTTTVVNTTHTITLGVNGGTIATAENTQLFLSGLITGSGPLILSSPAVGSSAIFFFGSTANNYTGPTTVQTGFVELGGSGVAIPGDLLIQSASNVSLLASNQIAATATVTDHGFLNFDAGAALTQTIGTLLGDGQIYSSSAFGGTLTVGAGNFSGLIFDNGGPVALVKQSAGTLILTGNNSYSGGTALNAGVLSFANGALGSGLVTFTGNSTLQWNGSNTQDISTSNGVAIDAGVTATFDTNGNNVNLASSLTTGAGSGITKIGAGTLTLGGANTYNGATTVANGTLQAGSATGFSSASAFTVASAGTLDVNGFAVTIGSLAGGGTVTNNGATAGALITGNDNTNTTFTGTLQDGSALSLTKVGTGTLTLGGASTYTGGTTLQAGVLVIANRAALGAGNVTVNGGALQAGGSNMNIQVGGNYRQTGGELDLRIGGTTTGAFDRLTVAGGAALAGRLSVSSINGFVPKNGESLAVITAGAGVTGQFQQVTGNLSNYPLVKLTVDYLPNEVLLDFSQGSFRKMFTADALTPNERAAAFALDNLSSNAGSARLFSYLDSLPINGLPAAFNLISPTAYGAIYSISRSAAKADAVSIENRLDEAHAAAASTTVAGPAGSSDFKGSKEIMPPPEDRLSVYTNGSGEFVSVGNTSNAAGYNFGSGAATVGIDYRFTEHFLAGVLLNYTGTSADLVDGGRLNANAFRGGAYASLFGGGAYVNAYVGGADNDYDVSRAGLGGFARGSTGGGDFDALIATGYDAHAGGFTYGPVASFQYTYTSLDAFNETGSRDPLHVNAGYGTSLLTNVGMRATYDWHIGGMVLVPEVRATWQHEYGDTFDEVSATMLVGGPAFGVTSSPIGRDSLLLNVGFTLRITPELSAYAFYDGELARTNYQANNVMLGFRAGF